MPYGVVNAAPGSRPLELPVPIAIASEAAVEP